MTQHTPYYGNPVSGNHMRAIDMSREPTSRYQQQIDAITRLEKTADHRRSDLKQRCDALAAACSVAEPTSPVHPRRIRIMAQLSQTQAELRNLRRLKAQVRDQQSRRLRVLAYEELNRASDRQSDRQSKAVGDPT
jgi:hypothetical protein